MFDAHSLTSYLKRNAAILAMQADGLSHADSLRQTPYNINCLNWVIGHIADSRESMIEALGGAGVTEDGELERYRRETEPITEDGPGVVALDRLLGIIETGQERLAETIAAVPDAAWDEEVSVGDRMVTLASRARFWYFHDTYHTGQAELLRQVAGTDDKII